MDVILDASYAVEAVAMDADQLFDQLDEHDVWVPSIYLDECRNSMIRRVRMRDLPEDRLLDVVDSLLAWPDAVLSPAHELIVDTAMQHGLNGFDAAYLALALQAGDGIATLDKQVQQAAETLGLVVFS
jgi:predicted nucleic acid-binding protein